MNEALRQDEIAFIYRRQADLAAASRERTLYEQRAKALSDREVIVLAAMKWLKSLRDEFPGLIQGTDEEMHLLAGRVVNVLLAGV
jgi:hypothetical protein